MAVEVTINGTSYTVPESGDGDWGNTLSTFLQAVPAAGSGILTFGNSSTPNSASTYYIRPVYVHAVADTTEITFRVPAAGKVAKLYVQASSAPSGGSCIFTVRKNAADTALTCTLAAAATQAADSTNSFTVQAGDRLSLKNVQSATTGTGVLIATILFTPS